MPQALLAIFTQIASVIGGGINGALGMMTSLISKGFQATIQFHKEGISFAREVGLSAKEAQAYTQVLTERTEKLALKYGVTVDAIKEVQRGIVDATSKQYMLNEAEAERQVQINKLVGAGTANQFTEQMMNHMGAQLSTVQGAVSKAYATAAKSGLNVAKFSKEVAKNLSLANKLSFRDGVNGIIRMTALSEKLGFNLQSVENAANKFMDLDSAIESSAQLQMLGGAAGAYGSNPLTMAYEANYDPEAFTERMTKMLGGYAQFDAKTGMANVNGMNRDFVKNIAQAMGISMDEAMSIAKKQAEIKYKEGAYSTELGKISKENRDAVLNRSYVDTNTGHLMINDVSGKAHDITKNGLDESILEELQKFDNMSEKDIMQKQAETLTDIQQQIDGIGDSFAASIAKHLNQYIPGATTAIKNFAKEVQPSVVEIGRNLGEFVKTALDWLRDNKETIKNVAKGVFGVTAWLTKHWPLLIALWAGKKILGVSLPGGTTLGGKLGAKALGGVKNVGGKALNAVKTMWKTPFKLAKSSIRAAKAFKGAITHGSGLKGAFSAAKTSLSRAGTLKTFGKLAKSGGIGILGAVGGIGVDYLADKGKIQKGGKMHQALKATTTAVEYGAVGAMFGPLGAGIGAAVGAIKGAYDTWKSLPENADKDFIDYAKSVGDSIVEGGKEAFNWVKEKIGPALSAVNKDIEERGGYLSVAFNMITTPIRLFISAIEGIGKLILHPIDTIKNAWNSLKNWWNSDNKLERLWNVGKNAVMGEKHADGGIVGAKPKSVLIENDSVIKNKYIENHAIGGIVGGNSYSGDRILTGLNSGEMVLNKDQQAQLFKFIQNASSMLTKIGSSNGVTYYNASNKYSNLSSSYDTSRISSIFDNRSIREKHSSIHNNVGGNSISSNDNRSIREKHSAIHNNVGGNILSNILSTIFNSNSNIVSSALNTNNNIKTVPFGENSFRKIPKSDYTEYSYNKGGEIIVKDINLNVNGTLKLDAGTVTKNLDINQLLSDTTFISSLKDLIKQSINNDMNGGRFMNDNATLRGSLGTTTYWGR